MLFQAIFESLEALHILFSQGSVCTGLLPTLLCQYNITIFPILSHFIQGGLLEMNTGNGREKECNRQVLKLLNQCIFLLVLNDFIISQIFITLPQMAGTGPPLTFIALPLLQSSISSKGARVSSSRQKKRDCGMVPIYLLLLHFINHLSTHSSSGEIKPMVGGALSVHFTSLV